MKIVIISFVMLMVAIASSVVTCENVGDGGEMIRRRLFGVNSAPLSEYLVVLKEGKHFEDVAAFQSTGRRLGSQTSSEILDREDLLTDGRVVKISFDTEEGVLRAMDDPDVVAVEPDYIAHAAEDPEQTNTPTSLWGLDIIDGYMNNNFAHHYTGKGVHIYVLDTGIRATHSEFKGRVEPGKDFIDNDDEPEDAVHGHGTHCASTALGTSYGVAKGATLVGVRVLDTDGNGPYSTIIKGVNWAAQQAQSKGQRAVLSISIGGGYSVSMNTAVEEAVTKYGVAVSVAAGNENSDACSYSPASANEILTVGSINQALYVSQFSNYGTCVGIFAPGSSVLGAGIWDDFASRTLSGTSMACPHVSGALAMLWEKHPEVKSGAKIQQMLVDSFGDNDKIFGEMNASPNKLLRVPYPGETPEPVVPKQQMLLVDDVQYKWTNPTFGPGYPSDEILEGMGMLVNPREACEDLSMHTQINLENKVAIIRRGGCTFHDKIKRAQKHGAIAVIMINNVPSEENLIMKLMDGVEDDVTIPSVMVTFDSGEMIEHSVENGKGIIKMGMFGPDEGQATKAPNVRTYSPTSTSPTFGTYLPSSRPTEMPTSRLTASPSEMYIPTPGPTSARTDSPSEYFVPTAGPTFTTTYSPSDDYVPTPGPTATTTYSPSEYYVPSAGPTMDPTEGTYSPSMDWKPSFMPTFPPSDDGDYNLRINIAGFDLDPSEVGTASFGPALENLNPAIDGKLVYGVPKEFCSVDSKVDYKNSIVFVKRGSCSFGQKVKNAQLAGAVAVVIGNNVIDGGWLDMILPDNFDFDFKIPSLFLKWADSESVANELEQTDKTHYGRIGLEKDSSQPTPPPTPYVPKETMVIVNGIRLKHLGATFGPKLYSNEIFAILDFPLDEDNQDGCQMFPSNLLFQNSILLLRRGSCQYETKVYHAQLAGALGVIVYNSVGDDLLYMEPNPAYPLYEILIPSAFIGNSDGTNIVRALENGEIMKIRVGLHRDDVPNSDLTWPPTTLPTDRPTTEPTTRPTKEALTRYVAWGKVLQGEFKRWDLDNWSFDDVKTNGMCVQFDVKVVSKKYTKKSLLYLAIADHPSMKSNYLISVGKPGISLDRNSVEKATNNVLDLSFSNKKSSYHYAQIAPLSNGGLRVEYGVRDGDQRYPLVLFDDENPLTAVRLFSFSSNKKGLVEINGIKKCKVVDPDIPPSTKTPTREPEENPTKPPTKLPTVQPSGDKEKNKHTFKYISKKPYFIPSPFDPISNGNSPVCFLFEACGTESFFIALQKNKKPSSFRQTAYAIGIGMSKGKKNTVYMKGKSRFSSKAPSQISSAVKKCNQYDSYEVNLSKSLELRRNGKVIMVYKNKFGGEANYVSGAVGSKGETLNIRNVRPC